MRKRMKLMLLILLSFLSFQYFLRGNEMLVSNFSRWLIGTSYEQGFEAIIYITEEDLISLFAIENGIIYDYVVKD